MARYDYPLYEILTGTFQAAISVLACPALALAGLLLGQFVRWGTLPGAYSFFIVYICFLFPLGMVAVLATLPALLIFCAVPRFRPEAGLIVCLLWAIFGATGDIEPEGWTFDVWVGLRAGLTLLLIFGCYLAVRLWLYYRYRSPDYGHQQT